MRIQIRGRRDPVDAHLPRRFSPIDPEMAEGLALLGAREGIGHVEIVAREVQVELVIEEQQ